MKLNQILESRKSHRLVVVLGGRFQPFHKGHWESYRWLCKKFGEENVWIATSNKTNFNPNSGEVSPFTFKEKKEIITSLYNVNPRRIIMCKNPAFSPSEIFDMYGDFDVTYVSAVGKKDIERYKTGTFFRPLPSPFSLKDLDMLATRDEQVGYYVEIPMQFKDLSGTIVRDELKKAQGDDREVLFKKYFGKYDSMIDALIKAKLKEVTALKEPKE